MMYLILRLLLYEAKSRLHIRQKLSTLAHRFGRSKVPFFWGKKEFFVPYLNTNLPLLCFFVLSIFSQTADSTMRGKIFQFKYYVLIF